MEFKRKKRVKGKSQKYHKEWYSGDKQYRITWRRESMGVAVIPGYLVCVRCVGSTEFWDFAGRRGPYRSLNAAIKAARRHRKVWERAIELAGGKRRGRADKLRSLKLRAKAGKGHKRHDIFSSLPCWVLKSCDERTLRILQQATATHVPTAA